MNIRTHTVRALMSVVALVVPWSASGKPQATLRAAPVRRTYVYLLDGVNPLGAARLQQLGDQLRGAGFPDTRVGGWYRVWEFEREIREAHAADPTARFALIGYSAGAYRARAAANRLLRDGVPLAVVGYIGADYMFDGVDAQVIGAGRVVNVTGDGYLLTGRNLLFNGTEVLGARNIRLVGTRHYALPTHPETFAILYAELTADD